MKELLDKITSYNLFNYLLPGIIYCFIIDHFILKHSFLINENLIIDFFIFYTIGLIISRIGSLLVEPFLKTTKFIKYSDYKDYLYAVSKDSKIETLLEANNMYRTFISLFLFIIITKVYFEITTYIKLNENFNFYSIICLLIILFLFSFKKQTEYINKRVDNQKT